MPDDQDWYNDEEKARVQKFRQLMQALKESLADVKVFQAGGPEADVYIVGRGSAGWAGLRTKAVET